MRAHETNGCKRSFLPIMAILIAAALPGSLRAQTRGAVSVEGEMRQWHKITLKQQRDMAAYLRRLDPYDHHIVVHTFPNRQDAVYPHLLGNQSVLTGASLQNGWDAAHQRVLKWVRASAESGRPWVVAQDEQNPASMGVPPDPGYHGFDGKARDRKRSYDLHDIRKYTLWGTLKDGDEDWVIVVKHQGT